MPGSPVRCDQPQLVGGDHRLHAITKSELGENAADVRLHGPLRDVQALSDLRIAQSLREYREHITLAIGQHGQRRDVTTWPAGDVLLDQPPGDRRGEEDAPSTTCRIAEMMLSGPASFSRKALAPARSAA